MAISTDLPGLRRSFHLWVTVVMGVDREILIETPTTNDDLCIFMHQTRHLHQQNGGLLSFLKHDQKTFLLWDLETTWMLFAYSCWILLYYDHGLFESRHVSKQTLYHYS